MTAVYTVIVSNDKAELEVCESYAGVASALSRAFHLASKLSTNPIYVNVAPEAQKQNDGSVRWTFLETNRHFVGVVFNHIVNRLSSLNLDADRPVSLASIIQVPLDLNVNGSVPLELPKLHLNVDGSVPLELLKQPVITEQVDPKPEPYMSLDDDSLPAGWFYDGTPALMKHLKRSAEDVKSTTELSDDEKWAVVIARVSKQVNLLEHHNGFTFVMTAALADLKARTSAGLAIRNKHLEWLDSYRDEIIGSYYDTL